MLNLTVSRKTSVPTLLLRNWIATGDARCPLICVWSNSRTAATRTTATRTAATPPAQSQSQSADSTLEYAQCA